jgi:hypothetical protein
LGDAAEDALNEADHILRLKGFSHIKTMVIENGAYISTTMREFK